MMQQWETLKKSVPHALLLFRLGDFYEAFYDDALRLSKELDLTLTKRQDVPMAGVPFHTCETYVDRLVSKGYHVAIAEQTEDAREAKGLVRREIVRIVTPGTLITSTLLPEKGNNFLVCVVQLNQLFGVAALDLTTAEFRVFELEEIAQLQSELLSLSPAEILLSEKFQSDHAQLLEEFRTRTVKENWQFNAENALSFLLRHFKVQSLDGFGLKAMPAAISAAGALLRYVQEDLNLTVAHIQKIQLQAPSQFMAIDHATARHLELLSGAGRDGHTLLSLLDETCTPMGGRLLKQWILHPLLSKQAIEARQQAIEAFLGDPARMRALQNKLSSVRDLERLIMRIETGYATPRDLLGLALSLEPVQSITEEMSHFSAEIFTESLAAIQDPSPLATSIRNALVDEPPLRTSEGAIFRKGYHAPLDELREMRGEGSAWIARYQTELREKTGIKTLKVGFTRVFGYYIEVSRGQAERLIPHAERRQTLANAERFTTPELKEYELRTAAAEEKMLALENELFHALRAEISKEAPAIRSTASALAKIDCLLSLATVARHQNYTLPLVDESDIFHLEESRHPVLEKALKADKFIPNDLHLNSYESRLLLITGPNMAGKSTYLRQAALIAILAQIGSFVPAKKAHIGIIDKLFSRIGASDDLSRGQSTFMVEMTETANILHNATTRSLVLLDEIGRGTSTYDGISIAWAVSEQLLAIRAKTLFATHYWELTELEDTHDGVVNAHVAVHEAKDGIIFLRKILKGRTDKSYGIHVARLAGLPSPVIRRATELLKTLEKKSRSNRQLSLFSDV